MDRPENQPPTQAAMHVGVQGIGTSPKELAFLVRHGVTHMMPPLRIRKPTRWFATKRKPRRRV